MQARAFPSQASRPFEVPARHGRQARSTQLQLAFGQMTLLPPRNAPRASKEPVTVWVIRVWEEQTRDAEELLEWLRLPSVPTMTLEQAWERVDWYRCRWSEEDSHHCLKSGCRIEERQLQMVDGLMRRLGSVVPTGRALVAGACLRSGRPRAPRECGDWAADAGRVCPAHWRVACHHDGGHGSRTEVARLGGSSSTLPRWTSRLANHLEWLALLANACFRALILLFTSVGKMWVRISP